MIKLLLDYFKSYQIDVDQLMDSDAWNGCLDIKDPKDLSQKKYRLNYKIDRDLNETSFFFWCRNDKSTRNLIHNFSMGFKNIARAHDAVIIDWFGQDEGYYGWCDLNPPIGFGIKNEVIGFTMRLVIQKSG